VCVCVKDMSCDQAKKDSRTCTWWTRIWVRPTTHCCPGRRSKTVRFLGWPPSIRSWRSGCPRWTPVVDRCSPCRTFVRARVDNNENSDRGNATTAITSICEQRFICSPFQFEWRKLSRRRTTASWCPRPVVAAALCATKPSSCRRRRRGLQRAFRRALCVHLPK